MKVRVLQGMIQVKGSHWCSKPVTLMLAFVDSQLDAFLLNNLPEGRWVDGEFLGSTIAMYLKYLESQCQSD